jgi:ParB-like chromosome segregation protein Spo0J
MRIPLTAIRPAAKPIRSSWDEGKMEELAQSVKEQGLIVPIKVRPLPGVKRCIVHGWAALSEEREPECMGCDAAQRDGVVFEVVYGNRRLEAARRAGEDGVEAIVETVGDTDALVQALIENILRENISDIEKGNAYIALRAVTGWDWSEMARHLGYKSTTAVSECVSLVLDPAVSQVFSKAILDQEHPMRDLADKGMYIRGSAPEDPVLRKALAEKVVTEDLSGPQTAKMARAVAVAPSEKAREVLLSRPYNPTLHDPEMVKTMTASHPVWDPQAHKDAQTWEHTPEAKALLERWIQWDKLGAEMRRMSADMFGVGKLAPEARQYLIERARRMAESLNRWADEQEAKGNAN